MKDASGYNSFFKTGIAYKYVEFGDNFFTSIHLFSVKINFSNMLTLAIDGFWVLFTIKIWSSNTVTALISFPVCDVVVETWEFWNVMSPDFTIELCAPQWDFNTNTFCWNSNYLGPFIWFRVINLNWNHIWICYAVSDNINLVLQDARKWGFRWFDHIGLVCPLVRCWIVTFAGRYR